MRSLVLFCGLSASCVSWAQYDLHTPALTPIRENVPAQHAPLSFVKDGKLGFCIAVSRSALKQPNWSWTSDAVCVVTQAFAKTTGHCPQVVDASDKVSLGKHAFILSIGDNPISASAGVDGTRCPLQGFSLRSFEKGVAISGYDSGLDRRYRRSSIDRRGASTGTYYGVLDFVERFLGVRYLYPGEFGTVWPRIENLVINPVSYDDAPVFNVRGGPGGNRYYFWLTVAGKGSLAQLEPAMGTLKKGDTSFLSFWRDGGVMSPCGHHCPNPQKLGAALPDKRDICFLRNSSGKLYYNEKQHIGNYFNVLDLRFADLLIDLLHRFYKSGGKDDPAGFGGEVNEDYITFGVCDTGMEVAEIKDLPIVRELGLVTDRDIAEGRGWANVYARFIQYYAGRIKAEFPGKKLFVLAYINADRPSLDPRWKFPDNVEIMLCDGNLPLRVLNEKAMESTRSNFQEWQTALGGRPISKLWLYANGLNPFARAVGPEFIVEIPRRFKGLVANDMYFYDFWYWQDMWVYYYASYAMYKAYWNPAVDVDAVVDEHWDLFYGPQAGPHMRRFHRVLKDAFLKYYVPSKETYPQYPIEVLDELDRELKEAGACLADGSVEKRRWRLMGDYWPDVIETQRVRAAYVPPVYQVGKLESDSKIAIDGNPSESVWKSASAFKLRDPRGGKAPTRFPCTIKLLRGEKGLYGMTDSPYPSAADPKVSVWRNDSIELHLCPGLLNEVKYHIAFDGAGDRYSSKQRFLPIWQPADQTWKVPGGDFRNVVSEDGWTSEFLIPWSAFEEGAPKDGDRWHANVIKTKPGSGEVRGSALTLGNHHNMKMYGFLEFLPAGTVQTETSAWRWRGFMLDEARHFFGKEKVKEYLDLMASRKMNVFHWHLTDDQGWRIDLPGLPELVKYGAVRSCSPRRGEEDGDGKPYGPYFYTADDIREIVRYAKDRGIDVLPEFDVPGHVRALLAAHPEFACNPQGITRDPRTRWGISDDVLCIGNTQAVEFVERVIDGFCELFPFPYFHIGGDECPTVRWRQCPKCRDLTQAGFTRHLIAYLEKKGRTAIGWDEIAADAELPRKTVVQCWRNRTNAVAVVRSGHPVIMSPLTETYLSIPPGVKDDPWPYRRWVLNEKMRITVDSLRSFDPMKGLPEDVRHLVWGGECCAWTEEMASGEELDFKVRPRLSAFGEALSRGSAR